MFCLLYVYPGAHQIIYVYIGLYQESITGNIKSNPDYFRRNSMTFGRETLCITEHRISLLNCTYCNLEIIRLKNCFPVDCEYFSGV